MTLTYQRILVPLDGSERAAAALRHAEAVAKPSNSLVILLQVIPNAATLVSETAVASPSLGFPAVDPFLSATQFEAVETALEEEARTTLQSAAASLTDNGVRVESIIIRGIPADAILDYTRENQVDLIAMSTHGRTGLARLVYGSVAESVLHRATCPVLMVRVAGPE